MTRNLRIFITVFACVVLAGTARADVLIRSISWRLPEAQGAKISYKEAGKWLQPPAARLDQKPRAVVVLINRGPQPAEGVLLRYAVSARLIHRGDAADSETGIWTVPFKVDDRRIPWLKPNEIKEIPIDNLLLATYFKRLSWSDYWPNAIRIQVMIEARRGEKLTGPAEQELPVLWDAKGAK